MTEFNKETYQAGMHDALMRIYEQIDEACQKSLRPKQSVKLIAVSKTVDLEQVCIAYDLGLRYFGENRPQELVRKHDALDDELDDVHFHMIGNLQSNKINSLLTKADLIHSVSSVKLANQINMRAQREGLDQKVLLEVNVSGEQSKEGMSPKELEENFESILALESLNVQGLMTMAPQGDLYVAEKTFEGLRLLQEKLKNAYPSCNLDELSMGMSEDFTQAIQQGATIIRLGRSIFDPQFNA